MQPTRMMSSKRAICFERGPTRSIAQLLSLLLCATYALFGQSSHSVSLNWAWEQDGGGTATGFNIKRGNTSGGPYAQVGALTSPSILTFTDFGPFVEGNTYYYVVTAVGHGGESSPSNEASATIPTTSLLTSSINPSTVGQVVTFSISLPGATAGLSGEVQFFDGNVLLGSAPVIGGQARFSTSTLTAGSHTIVAQYGGSVVGTRGQVVIGMSSTTTISTNPATPLYGQPVTLTVQLGPSPPAGFAAPNGQVMFQDNGYPAGVAPVASGKATLTLNGLTLGTHVITAVFSGDMVWASSYARTTLTVTQPILRMDNAAAATLSTNFAPDEAVDLFNVTVLRTDTVAPSLPLPNSLLGVTVSITDSAGVSRFSQLYYALASSGQLRFVIPNDTSLGPASLTVTGPGGIALSAQMYITRTAPGIFTANLNGQGVYAGQVVHVHADGSQTSESSAILDSSQNLYLPNPVDMGPPDDQVFLVLYGTGIRHRLSDASATASINGTSIPVESEAQGTYPGLDQVNLKLPRELVGAGTVDIVLTVEGQTANLVLVSIK
jgi:uncharacterized protein (TIGR03437 family)